MARPVFTTDTIGRVKQFGEIDKAVDIYVNVYSVPKFTSFAWTRKGTPITAQNSASSPTIVMDKIHGKEVKLDGFNVTLTIHDLKAEDFVNYTVTLKSGFPDVNFTIVLESSSVPETPGNFSTVASLATSITVQWDPHSGGGFTQTFYIQYRVQGSSEWTLVLAGEEDIKAERRRRTYEVTNLKEGKAYELRMYAENTAMKRSNFTEVLTSYTQSSAGPSVAAIIGGIAGGLTAIIIVLLVICFVQKRRKGKVLYYYSQFRRRRRRWIERKYTL
ncbi:uncharacterized protein LOC143079320 [Mytilus galloprovincialis]|uniref:uncharacterized protein LOC143079320 n=1 Tax=Mytilus galloprovincialis TaxID=29158 RepID=UPI003F7CBF77